MFITEKFRKRKRIMILALSILMSVVAICWYTVAKLRKDNRDSGAVFVESENSKDGGIKYYEKT